MQDLFLIAGFADVTTPAIISVNVIAPATILEI